MKKIKVSAPGKILWLGGYSILEKGNLGYVTTVNKRVFVELEKRLDETIVLEIPQYKIKTLGKFRENKIFFDEKLSEEKKEFLKFVKTALEITLSYLLFKKKKKIGFRIKTLSDKAFGLGKGKTGLGASAAVTVATVGAIFSAFNLSIKKNLNLITKISHFSHFLAQGKVGSGFDISAAVFGTHIYSRFSSEIISDLTHETKIEKLAKIFEKEWDFKVERLNWPKTFFVVFGNFIDKFTKTSEIVKKVLEFKERDKEKYFNLIKKLNEANLKAINALKKINIFYGKSENKYRNALSEFKEGFEEGRILTKKLGELSSVPIESDEFSELIEETKRKGAFLAKLPGAGGEDSICVICLNKKDQIKVENFLKNYKKKKIQIINIKITNEGLKES